MALVKKGTPISLIDNFIKLEPVLDYSFYQFSNVGDAVDEQPRNSKPARTPRSHSKKHEEEKPRSLSKSRCFFMNNNGLGELTGLRATMEHLFADVDNVAWINLSFNEIVTVDPLLELPNIEILYLHGNCIQELSEIGKLGALTKLKKATFHGNPVENVKGYRQFVLSELIHLKCLDFSDITREDRRRVFAWQMINRSKKKPVEEEED